MLGVGIDWAEEFHLVTVGRPEDGPIETLRVAHDPTAVTALTAKIARLEPDPAEVRVVIETRHGLLVEALLAAGYTVLPVNPDLVARRRGPARKKDDAEDSRICCQLALDRYLDLRPLIPHGQLAGELRSIARDDERTARDQRRLLNRLRADLIAVYPAGHTLTAEDLAAPTMLALLGRYPAEKALRAASRDELVGFARDRHHNRPQRFADRVAAALRADHFPADPALARAKADTIRLTANQLLLLNAQRRAWERRMGELLLGAPRTGRAHTAKDADPGNAIPGGEVYLSFPGLGDRLAARIAGEIGDHPEQFPSPNALACYAGKAPVTRRSGKTQLVVAHRLACNHYLANAVQHWAFCSLRPSTWAREFYDSQRARGKGHHAALRALGNRWLEVLWHCLQNDVRYDEATHIANRNRALSKTASAA